MFSVKLVVTEWNGQQGKEKATEANRRLTGSVAYDAQNEAKALAHVDSGRMQGSVTVLRPGSDFTVDKHATPMDFGKDRESAIAEVQIDGVTASVGMGAFVDYAFVEEVLRGHRFVLPGLDLARERMASRVDQVGHEVGFK